MKQELEAMVEAAQSASCDTRDNAKVLQAAFLAALHWRGDELWCGPVVVGYISSLFGGGITAGLCAQMSRHYYDSWTVDDAKSWLLSAAQDQVRKWFEEQGE